MPTFQPPATDTVPPFLASTRGPARRLMAHYKARARGRTLIIKGGVCRLTSYPSQTELDAADAYYLGGHVYIVSAAEEAVLVACGYSTTPDPSDSTWGSWASTTWGEMAGDTWESR
jgi:hypothetical protein